MNPHFSPCALALALGLCVGLGTSSLALAAGTGDAANPDKAAVSSATSTNADKASASTAASSITQASDGSDTSHASSADRKFVATATEAGLAEVEMAKLAHDHAASSEVSQFAAHMIEDHQKTNEDLVKIADAKGLPHTTTLSAKDQTEFRKLQSLSGAAFDREYVRVQLAAHKDAVALFQGESRNGKDAELKQFASSTLPTLQSHLQQVTTLTASTSGTQKTASAH